MKLYVREPGTDRMLAVAHESGGRFLIVAFTAVELRSAIRRREREGDISSPDAAQLLQLFGEHLTSKFVRQVVNEAVLEVAAELVDRHPLRAMDAVQLAGYMVIRSVGNQPVCFVCSDERLLRAAELEGAMVLNPAL